MDDLVETIYKCLSNNGRAYILIPDQRFFAVEFFKSLKKYESIVVEEKIYLDDERYI